MFLLATERDVPVVNQEGEPGAFFPAASLIIVSWLDTSHSKIFEKMNESPGCAR